MSFRDLKESVNFIFYINRNFLNSCSVLGTVKTNQTELLSLRSCRVWVISLGPLIDKGMTFR